MSDLIACGRPSSPPPGLEKPADFHGLATWILGATPGSVRAVDPLKPGMWILSMTVTTNIVAPQTVPATRPTMISLNERSSAEDITKNPKRKNATPMTMRVAKGLMAVSMSAP